jgi:hypothetical protein
VENYRKIQGAIAGACFIAITQLATRERLDGFQIFALCCFSSVLPFSALSAALDRVHDFDHKKDLPIYHLTEHLFGNAMFVFWLGLVALLFSFGWLLAVLFTVGSVIAVTIGNSTS